MKITEIHVRDPFILPFHGRYYLYGSRSFDEEQVGFDVYVSEDLENWSEPREIFAAGNGFWGERDFWAPEVHVYNGKFYMFATFKGSGRHRGTQVLVSDTPDGRFVPHSDGAVTPADYEALDGTLYWEDGKPYMLFCHEWTQIEEGTVCAVELSADLKRAVGVPRVLWRATDAPWIIDFDGKGHYITDGPFVCRCGTALVCLWSSMGKNGYVTAAAVSESGRLFGGWRQRERLLYDADGGHAMVFTAYDGKKKLVLHTPNTCDTVHPLILDFEE